MLFYITINECNYHSLVIHATIDTIYAQVPKLCAMHHHKNLLNLPISVKIWGQMVSKHVEYMPCLHAITLGCSKNPNADPTFISNPSKCVPMIKSTCGNMIVCS